MTYVILNHQLIPEDNAQISLSDRGFRYGDGVFETLRVQAGVPYQFAWHMARLARGLSALHISFDVATLQPLCLRLLQANHCREGILRIQITRGTGGRGYLPDAASTPTLVIETLPAPASIQEPVMLWLSSYEKPSPAALPVQVKTCQGLNSTLARIEAEANGAFDALLLNAKQEICETSSANIFWLKDNIVYTPALSCGVLEGSIRTALLRISPYPVAEVAATLETLTQAEAVFITNSAWGVIAVSSLQPRKLHWKSQEIAAIVRAALLADMQNDCAQHQPAWPEVAS